MEELERLIEEISDVQTKLIVLVGPSGCGKTRRLVELGRKLRVEPLNIGISLGIRLAPLTQRQRQLSVSRLLTEVTADHATGDLLLLDNLELLFDATLSVSPLDILRQQAHSRRIIAAWPGELRDGRLRYAEIGHPESRDYSSTGLVTFNIHEQEVESGHAV